MTTQEYLAINVWPLLEELYLASADDKAKLRYRTASEHDKRSLMCDFASQQALRSKRWATIAENLLVACRAPDGELASRSSPHEPERPEFQAGSVFGLMQGARDATRC